MTRWLAAFQEPRAVRVVELGGAVARDTRGAVLPDDLLGLLRPQ